MMVHFIKFLLLSRDERNEKMMLTRVFDRRTIVSCRIWHVSCFSLFETEYS